MLLNRRTGIRIFFYFTQPQGHLPLIFKRVRCPQRELTAIFEPRHSSMLKEIVSILIALLTAIIFATGQTVLDAQTGEPIPLATIHAVANPEIGTNSGEDGTFILNVEVGTSIRVSSVGYKPITTAYSGTSLIVLLEKQLAQIEEIIIRPDETEAARVLRLCVDHRDLNAPWQRDHFQCLLYNKYRVDLLQDSLAEPTRLVRMLEKRITGQTIFFSESAMTYSFEKPDRIKEQIIANNVAGFKSAQFNFLPEQLVSFDIHQDFLDLLNRHYVLPVSKGSERHYALHLEETKIYQDDTTWYIQFWPEKSNYDLLRGHIVIHSDNYGIEEYRLTNNKKDHQRFDIYHHFRKFNGQWFPDKMFSNIVMTDLGLNINVLYDQKTYIDEVRFDSVRIQVADVNRIDFAEGVKENPDRIVDYRLEPLSPSDQLAISNVSSTIEDLKIEKKMDIIANLSFGRLPIGAVDIDITRFFWSNKTEGYRPGIGLITNDKLSKRFSLEVFAGFGLNDDQWKYGGGLTYHMNDQESASLYCRYEKEIYPISSYVIIDASSGIIANFYSDQLDDITAYTGGIKGRLANWSYDFNYKKTSSTPRYPYSFQKNADEILNNFEEHAFNLGLNYVRKKLVPFYSYEISIEEYHSTYLDLQLSYVPENLFNSNIEYFSSELFIKRPINFKHVGRIELAAHAGIIIGDQPINRLHIGNGSNSSGIPYQMPYSFNTMRPFSHFADRYINLFYNHRLIQLYQTRLSAPYVHIAQHSGWGFLENSFEHLPEPLIDYRHGYHESGLILASIVRYEAFSLLYLGLNVGAWYRWGHYSSGDTKDDLVFKLGFSIHW